MRTKILTLALTCLAVSTGSSPADLIAHYAFTEEPGATAADESPAGNNDIPVVGSPTWLADEDDRQGVISFANTGNFRLNPPVDKPANGAPFTIAIWAKSDFPNQNQYSSLFSNGQGGANHFQIDSDGNGNWRFFGGAYTEPMGPIVDTWTHLAVTWDGSAASWYYDGELVGSGATNPGGNFDEFRIGTNRANDANGAVEAEIDEVQIWDEALDADAIAALSSGIMIIESFTADAEVIGAGSPLTLSWEVGQFDTLEIDNGVGDVSLLTTDGVGSIEVTPDTSTTYTLTATLDGTEETREVFVSVGEPPLIEVFGVVGADTIPVGGEALLTWTTFGATSLNLAPAPGDVTGETETVVNPTATTVYTLSATNQFGTTTAETTVSIREAALIARYNFTEEPSPTAIDESPGGTNSADVSFVGDSPSWLAEADGRTGVLSFDDTPGANIRLINPPTIPLPGDGFTVMLWAKSDQPDQGVFGSLFSNGQGGTNHFQFDADGNGNWRINTTNAAIFGPIVDEWTHLAVTWDGANRIMYYNGEPVGDPFPSNPGGSFDEYRIGVNRANDGPGAVDAEIDDVRIYDFALGAAEVRAAMTDDGSSGPPLQIEGTGDDLVFTWESQLGKLYTLRSELDPAASKPIDWPVFDGNSDLAATPPENNLTVPRPADPFRFFVIEEFNAPPVALFSDDFEGGPDAWTTTVLAGDGSTAWMHGEPTGDLGPGSANSGSAAFATNLFGPYTVNHSVALVSPVIDLTNVGEATLRYASFTDIEPGFDAGTITALDAADDSVIAEIAGGIDGLTANWTEKTHGIPAAAFGKMIKIEFRLTTDDFDATDFAGWYLDDVSVTTP